MYDDDKVPNSLKICQSRFRILPHTRDKLSKTAKCYKHFTKDAKFRQIWSHSSSVSHQETKITKNTSKRKMSSRDLEVGIFLSLGPILKKHFAKIEDIQGSGCT